MADVELGINAKQNCDNNNNNNIDQRSSTHSELKKQVKVFADRVLVISIFSIFIFPLWILTFLFYKVLDPKPKHYNWNEMTEDDYKYINKRAQTIFNITCFAAAIWGLVSGILIVLVFIVGVPFFGIYLITLIIHLIYYSKILETIPKQKAKEFGYKI